MPRRNLGGDRAQLHNMRACLLRKASSCMGDAAYEDDAEAGGQPDKPPMPTSILPSDVRPINEPKLSPREFTTSPIQDETSQITITAATTTTTATTMTVPMEPSDRSSKPNQQLQSPFFSTLPVELRRLIYTELFRSTNPLMKMHLHAAYDGARLGITPCHYLPSATYSTRDDAVDPMRTDPWPGWRAKNQPPRWFWHAWGLRLRWGPHWKCQDAEMMKWKARSDGTCVDLRGKDGGWLGMFLSCMRMYGEAIECFFESTSLIFTSSEDAFRFFVRNPHSHLSKIHDLDLTFNHFKDHLFLQPIESNHPRLLDSLSTPVSWEIWLPLMECIRHQLPELRSLRIHMSPPSSKGQEFLDVLRNWEKDGYGWAEEQVDGIVYLEKGRQRVAPLEDRSSESEV